MPLDQLEEHGRPVLDRLGEDLSSSLPAAWPSRIRWPSFSPAWPASARTCLRSGTTGWPPRLDVDEVEVVLQIEIRDPEHCGEVIGALPATGYALAFA